MSSSERNPPAGGLPPANLGAVFGDAGQRRGRLSSVLSSRAADPATAPVDPPAAEQAPAEDPTPAPVEAVAEPEVEHVLVDEDQAAGVDQETRTRQLIVYMPDRLRARLRRAAVGSTQLDVMLDAVEQTERAGVLGELVTQHQAPDTSGLFARRPARGSGSTVQINARAMHQHFAVLDRLATRYGTNRSELIRVALDHVLPGGRRAHH